MQWHRWLWRQRDSKNTNDRHHAERDGLSTACYSLLATHIYSVIRLLVLGPFIRQREKLTVPTNKEVILLLLLPDMIGEYAEITLSLVMPVVTVILIKNDLLCFLLGMTLWAWSLKVFFSQVHSCDLLGNEGAVQFMFILLPVKSTGRTSIFTLQHETWHIILKQGPLSLKIYLFVWMAELQSKTDRGFKTTADSFSKRPQRLGQVGARSFLCVSDMGTRAQTLGSTWAAFPSTLAGSWIRSEHHSSWWPNGMPEWQVMVEPIRPQCQPQRGVPFYWEMDCFSDNFMFN